MKVGPNSKGSSVSRRVGQGFVMLEVVLALLVFGLVSTALIRTLVTTQRLAIESQMDARLQLRLQSKMNEFHKMTNLQEWEGRSETSQVDELGVWTVVTVTRIEGVQTREGQELQQLYKVYVEAYYKVDWLPDPVMVDAEMWRYLPLYRTQGQGYNPDNVR